MYNRQKLEALYKRLTDERSKVIVAAAECDTVPPAKLLAYLADLDGSVAAVEAFLDERMMERPTPDRSKDTQRVAMAS